MCKRMNFRKKTIGKIIVFAVVCGMATGSVCVPSFAEEGEESLHNTSTVSGNAIDDIPQKDESRARAGEETGDEPGSEGEGTDIGKETDDESGDAGDTADFGGDVEEGASGQTRRKSVSGNEIEEIKEIEKETAADKTENEEGQEEPEVINVVVPTAYTLALNPYRLSIQTGEDEVTTKQIVSGMYGIVNKSSSDQIVTVSLTVEDGNAGELVFVDSAEEAENAGMNVYAIYLTAVPANEEQILIDDKPVDKNVTGESLRNVEMAEAQEQAVVLHEGDNEIAFKLSGAVYDVETAEESESTEESLENHAVDTPRAEEDPESMYQEHAVLKELAPDGKGVTAYTFSGVMNPNASWEKLPDGIKLSVVYTYRTADGDEEIVEGTGAMIS